MKRVLVACMLFCLTPALSFAAYQNPTCTAKVRLSNGQTKSTYEFRGNAGEPTVTREYVTSANTVNVSVREWVADTLAELDSLQRVDALPALQVGATPTPANRAAAARTAKQIWREKAQACAQFKGVFTGTVGTDVDAMCTDAQNTYQAGYLTE